MSQPEPTTELKIKRIRLAKLLAIFIAIAIGLQVIHAESSGRATVPAVIAIAALFLVLEALGTPRSCGQFARNTFLGAIATAVAFLASLAYMRMR